MSEFLPEYRAVPTASGWRPSFRRFIGEREKMVPYPGGPKYFPTPEAAKVAAMEYLRQQFNTPIVGCMIETPEELSEIENWRRLRDIAAAEEKARVFGDHVVTPRNKSGRIVELVVRKARARA